MLLLTVGWLAGSSEPVFYAELEVRNGVQNPLSVIIVVSRYFDVASGANQLPHGVLTLGDGTTLQEVFEGTRPFVSPISSVLVQSASITHTYGQAGLYFVGYQFPSRHPDSLHPTPETDTPYFTQAMIRVGELGPNNSPKFFLPPVYRTPIGQDVKFSHGGYDPQGDSLGFVFSKALISPTLELSGYIAPTDYHTLLAGNPLPGNFGVSSLGPTLVDEIGSMIWKEEVYSRVLEAIGGSNYRMFEFQFLVVVKVEEWRRTAQGLQLAGSTLRDMNIILSPTQSQEEIRILADREIYLNLNGSQIYRFSLERQSDLQLQSPIVKGFGEPFDSENPAFIRLTASAPEGEPQDPNASGNNPGTPSPDPGILPGVVGDLIDRPPSTERIPAVFSWEASCDHPRIRPYEILVFAGEATSGPEPTPYDIWHISTHLKTARLRFIDVSMQRINDPRLRLDWFEHSCPQYTSTRVYRKIGKSPLSLALSSSDWVEQYDYQLMAELEDGLSEWIDVSVEPSTLYCYRLVATAVNRPSSPPSSEVCGSISQVELHPKITGIWVIETHRVFGKILVGWSLSDSEKIVIKTLPNPQFSLLHRVRGEQEFRLLDLNEAQETFLHQGINTRDSQHEYQVQIREAPGSDMIGSSQAYPSLLIRNSGQRISWKVLQNLEEIEEQGARGVHLSRIGSDLEDLDILEIRSLEFDDQSEQFFFYLPPAGPDFDRKPDDSFFITITYLHSGAFEGAELTFISNKITVGEEQTPIPCPPPRITSDVYPDPCNDPFGCTSSSSGSVIHWEHPQRCDSGIVAYNLYFSSQELGDYTLLDSVRGTATSYRSEEAYRVGCYRISSVNSAGVEGVSEVAGCFEYCHDFSLPNVFTPNQDGYNDFFQPSYRSSFEADGVCPDSVISVGVRIFSADGKLIFQKPYPDDAHQYLWDGKSRDGSPQPPGMYYYSCSFDLRSIFNFTPSRKDFSGWLRLIK